MYEVLSNQIPKPDLMVFLHRSIDNLKDHITRRARPYEQNITKDYLQGLQNMYLEYFRNELSFPILLLDIDRINFVENRSHFQEIKNLLTEPLGPGLHRISFH